MHAITVLDILEETAQKYPDRIALIDEHEQFTYNMVLKQAKTLGSALNLMTNGITQKPIMIFIEKSCKCVIAMLGILFSGNIYVPLDIKNPIERINSITEILESNYILTTYSEKAQLEKCGYDGKILIYEEMVEKYEGSALDSIVNKIRKKTVDTDLMYIIFTSGSTGIPKGVAVSHHSIIDYIEALEKETNITCDDIVGNQAPFYSDMSLRDIYMSISTGATNCIIPQKYFMTPKKLLEYLEENKVSFLMWVPTAYGIIAKFDALSKIKPTFLKRFWFSGETMPVPVYRYWKRYYPNGEYVQLYGPTEITGVCTFYKVVHDYKDEEIIPIGKPFRNTGIILLDENNQEIKENILGVQGEICVYGSCLAAGYYNNRRMTDKVFVQNPFIKSVASKIYKTGDIAEWDADGNLIFITRKDCQIKHAGKRIELGEIESVVKSITEIEECCCVHNRKKDALVLFYSGEMDEKSIIKIVLEKLPKYMTPWDCRRIKQLPLLSNGKLDRVQMDKWINEN